ncbi:hypothetical protein JYA63_17390 [Fictibacillus nanhaiensis]|uniref:Uncharacterized protein n=1 Tax=Fictibacillus nanhaiensis TaxID=742169 RepID=A0ABS2ZV32_9BACL|nr:hypothetical protein [Fictibacillus nanhaiensis]
MTVKKKVAAFIAKYNEKTKSINDQIQETSKRLEDLSLEIQFIKEKEIPEAVQRRVFTGDRSQEAKIRKTLEKLQVEYQEKSEDLIVIQNLLLLYKQQAADEIRPLQKLFFEENNMVCDEAYERMVKARKVYTLAVLKETEILHDYRDINRQIQEIEVIAGRRQYAETVFPIDSLKLKDLSIDLDEITRIAKRFR